MKKAIILCGLPGSGKSSFAKVLQNNNPSLIRINRDSIREMIGLPYNPILEENIVKETQLKIANLCHIHEYPILIDDTNVKKESLENWIREFHAFGFNDENIEVIFMNTPIESCIVRDKNRKNSVGEKVIRDMYEKNKDFIENLIIDNHVTKVNPLDYVV